MYLEISVWLIVLNVSSLDSFSHLCSDVQIHLRSFISPILCEMTFTIYYISYCIVIDLLKPLTLLQTEAIVHGVLTPLSLYFKAPNELYLGENE